MGHLEDELARLRMEVEALDTERTTTAAERQKHLQGLIGAIHRGDSVDEYDLAEVERIKDTMARYGVAAERVLDRLTASGARLGQDGGLRLD